MKETPKGRITVTSSFFMKWVVMGGGFTHACPFPFLQRASRQIFKDECIPPPRIFLQRFKKRQRKIAKTVFLIFKEP